MKKMNWTPDVTIPFRFSARVSTNDKICDVSTNHMTGNVLFTISDSSAYEGCRGDGGSCEIHGVRVVVCVLDASLHELAQLDEDEEEAKQLEQEESEGM